MEYHKIIHLLDNTLNHPTKIKTKAYNTNSQIKFKLQC